MLPYKVLGFFLHTSHLVAISSFGPLWNQLQCLKKNLKESLGCWGLCEGGWCVKYYKASLNCLTVPTLCLAWAASHGSRSWTLLVPFADSKWKRCCGSSCEMGCWTRETSQQVRAVLFYKSVSCWVQSGERSVGYPTIVLLVLVSELQCTVLHKSVWKCKLKNCAL